jgi:CubicO group peptidase (beta-lactamase class C family)
MLAEAAALVLARRMYPQRVFPWFAFLSSLLAVAAAAAEAPRLPGVGAAMQQMVAQREIAGAVTVVIAKDRVLHLESTGFADVATQRAMTPDTLFNIMSMTKPVTAVALLMLQDEGKLRVSDPVAKFIPEFAALKTPSGQPANLTIAQLMTHTSGLGEAGGAGARDAHTLADLVPLWLAAPMQYEPGAKWRYTQSGINCAARIVEVASGMSFPDFLARRLFGPLGMKDTTHTPSGGQVGRIATPYTRNKDTGGSEAGRVTPPAPGERPPTGNAGLYASAADYARFCQMLLNGGELAGSALSERGGHGLSDAAADRRTTHGLFSKRHLWPIRCELRLGHWHVHPEASASGPCGRCSRPAPTVTAAPGHAGVDRSGQRHRLRADGAAHQFSEQRCERGAVALPGGRCRRDEVRA